ENDVDNTELVELVQRGRFARTRGRFPAPVLLVGGKFICRSSTLARSPEIYGRTSYQYLLHGEAMPQAEHDNNIANGSPAKNGMVLDGEYPEDSNKEWLVDKMRNTDIDLLHMLNVNVICDFMVEKKKVKFGLNVTSSEKVDREQRYADFDLISIPYPGCEFFADYTNNNYMGEGLKFDWTQQFVDAALQLPDNMKNIAEVQWNDYMHWDIVKLTQNYVKLLLNCLSRQNSTGILLHCISGWDRTPLFVSLLRLSLWADGLVHQSLSPEEVVYLTLAYDWLLFSHQFADRIDKCEEIMHFCFDFLKYIRSPIFSLL
uniref:Myotubularin phosphatase domain-containing protein n=1 Tax=Ciona savignyi TaxID=51511 RepID=H2YAR0_CIOSA